jgi:hypothetical protein
MTGSTIPPWSLAHPSWLKVGQKTKNLSRVREVCARVEDDGGRPYLVVRGGHCGPARLLPIIMTNESTWAVWHNPPPCSPPSQDAVDGCRAAAAVGTTAEASASSSADARAAALPDGTHGREQTLGPEGPVGAGAVRT